MSKETKRIILQAFLFIATFVTTTIAGAEWTYGKSVYVAFTWDDFVSGMHFSIPFLLILTVHEFGHYFTARKNQVNSSLPYYIPIPPFPVEHPRAEIEEKLDANRQLLGWIALIIFVLCFSPVPIEMTATIPE